MVFNSTIFLLIFLPSTIFLYYFIRKDFKNLLLVVSSFLFLFWNSGLFGLVFIVQIYLQYLIVRQIHETKGEERNFMLFISLTLLISMIFILKILGLFDSIKSANQGFNIFKYIPIFGTSFVTFQLVSYSLEVYRNETKPANSLVDLLLYSLFFPQLVAGPIWSFSEAKIQLEDRELKESYDNRLIGIFRFSLGLAKLFILSGGLFELYSDCADEDMAKFSFLQAWIMVFSFAMYVYITVSGLTDMSLGMAKIFGFSLPENFKTPYLSNGFQDFWQRWNISLYNWWKRNSKSFTDKKVLSLIFLAIASILWYGFSIQSIFWLIFLAFALWFEQLGFFSQNDRLKQFLFLIILMLSWPLVIGKNLNQVGEIYQSLLGFGKATNFVLISTYQWSLIGLCIFILVIPVIKKVNHFNHSLLNVQELNLMKAMLIAFSSVVLITISLCFINTVSIEALWYLKF